MSYPKNCLLYFSTSNCPVCMKLDDNFETCDIELEIFKVTPETFPKIMEEFSIFAVPTVILIKDGKEIDRFTGARSSKQIQKWVKQYI